VVQHGSWKVAVSGRGRLLWCLSMRLCARVRVPVRVRVRVRVSVRVRVRARARVRACVGKRIPDLASSCLSRASLSLTHS